MAVTHSLAARNALANALAALVDVAGANPNGVLYLYDATSNIVATHQLAIPSFQAAALGTILANAVANDPACTVGAIPVRFEVHDRNGNLVFGGSVGVNGDLGSNGQPLTAPSVIQNFAYQAPV